jgi:hypothetical protein
MLQYYKLAMENAIKAMDEEGNSVLVAVLEYGVLRIILQV